MTCGHAGWASHASTGRPSSPSCGACSQGPHGLPLGRQAQHEAWPDLPVLRGSSDRGRPEHPLALRMSDGRKGRMAPMAAGGHGQPTCSEHGSR